MDTNNAQTDGTKQMFTEQNTEDFTTAQLVTLNEALAIRMARGEDEKNASDAVNNAFVDGASVADLTA